MRDMRWRLAVEFRAVFALAAARRDCLALQIIPRSIRSSTPTFFISISGSHPSAVRHPQATWITSGHFLLVGAEMMSQTLGLSYDSLLVSYYHEPFSTAARVSFLHLLLSISAAFASKAKYVTIKLPERFSYSIIGLKAGSNNQFEPDTTG